MSKKIFGLIIVALSVATIYSATPAIALGTISDGASSARGSDQPTNLFGDTGIFSQISSILLFAVGAVAVIMIIIGGLRYVISGGNSEHIQSAKNTILYAIVGIIVALLAYAAVNFVINSFVGNSSTTGNSPSYGQSTR